MRESATAILSYGHFVTDASHVSMRSSAAQSDDARMAEACARGDSAAFEEIYRRHGERMKSVAFNHLGTTADAEDAVQEAFLKIHRGASSWNGEASFSTWIYRILINTCYDMLRKRKRRPDEAPIELLPEEGNASRPVDTSMRLTLRKLLGRLPEQRRSVFLLFEVEGLSHAEIGAILGIREGHSKWLLFTAKQELQKLWRMSTREVTP